MPKSKETSGIIHNSIVLELFRYMCMEDDNLSMENTIDNIANLHYYCIIPAEYLQYRPYGEV